MPRPLVGQRELQLHGRIAAFQLGQLRPHAFERRFGGKPLARRSGGHEQGLDLAQLLAQQRMRGHEIDTAEQVRRLLTLAGSAYLRQSQSYHSSHELPGEPRIAERVMQMSVSVSTQTTPFKTGAVAAIGGAVLLPVCTMLHPMSAD